MTDKIYIDILPLSERTRNALISSNILTTQELYTLSDTEIKSLKGIGELWFSEIKKAKEIINSDKKAYWISNTKNNWENKWPDFTDKSLFIPVKKNKSDGLYASTKQRIVVLDEYLYKVYQWKTTFSTYDFFWIFFNTLDDDEKIIVKNRLMLLKDEQKYTLAEISKNTWLTWERIRQKEKNIIEKLNEAIWWLSETIIGEKIIWDILFTKWDTFIIDYSEFQNNSLNWKFLCYFNSKIISKDYESYCLDSESDFWEKSLILNKKVFKTEYIESILKNILKIYEKKRPENEIIPLEKIIPNKIISEINIEEYEYPISLYLYHKYNIIKVWSGFVFRKNKKELKYFVKKELYQLEKPIHFTELYKILVEKYPEYKWNLWKVQHWLFKYWTNVWNWLYIKKTSSMKWWTIKDLAEEYLEDLWEPISFHELVEYIHKHKIVKKESIDAILFSQYNEIFMKYWNWDIWLVKRWIPKLEAPKFLADCILDFLNNNKWKYYSCNDLLNTWELWDKIELIRNSAYYLKRKWKIKITKKWSTTYFYCD